MRKTKINCYENLDEKEIVDENNFWKTFKTLLFNKSITSDKTHLSENGKLISSESKIAEVLKEFF